MPLDLDRIVRAMARSATLLPDGWGLFRGSPRPLMEVPGVSVSSGWAYRALREKYGIVRRRPGEWLIPPRYMTDTE